MRQMELLDRIKGMSKVGQRFPGILGVGKTFPMDKIKWTTTKEFQVENGIDFVFKSIIDHEGRRWGRDGARRIIRGDVRSEERLVKDREDTRPRHGEFELE